MRLLGKVISSPFLTFAQKKAGRIIRDELSSCSMTGKDELTQ
jgi:hypothetical protein